jgi:hypothetical protein
VGAKGGTRPEGIASRSLSSCLNTGPQKGLQPCGIMPEAARESALVGPSQVGSRFAAVS